MSKPKERLEVLQTLPRLKPVKTPAATTVAPAEVAVSQSPEQLAADFNKFVATNTPRSEAINRFTGEIHLPPALFPDPPYVGAESWEAPFLNHFSDFGGPTLSARHAGVTLPHVKKRQHASPVFDACYAEARELLIDSLEKTMIRMGRGEIKSSGFLPMIAMLKSLRPAVYNDKLQVSQHIKVENTYEPDPAEIRQLLLDGLSVASPETLRELGLLSADVKIIDVEEISTNGAAAR